MKHHIWTRMAAMLCAGCLLLGGCVNRPDGEKDHTSNNPGNSGIPSERTLSKGISFSVSDAEQQQLDVKTASSLLGLMKAETVRVEVEMAELIAPDGTLRGDAAERYHTWFAAMKENGVKHILLTVTGGQWGSDYRVDDRNAYPYPDRDTDSPYGEFLALYQKSFATLASAFPEVNDWQAGGALNLNACAHPADYATRGTVFSLREKAGLALDLAYAARQGIQSVRTDARVLLAGFSAEGGYQSAVDFLEAVYWYASSGRSPYGALTPDACFDVLSWEPYVCWYSFDAEEFIAGNALLYETASAHGNANTPVVFTGCGFCDYGSRNYDIQQAEWLGELWHAVETDLPYVQGFYPARLLEADSVESEKDIYSGLFRVFGSDSFGAKEKAKALCGLYEGEIGQLDTYIKNHTVYQDQQETGDTRNGICFAMKGAEERGMNMSKIMDLLDVMNVQSLRNWMNICTLLTSPTKLNDAEVALQKQWIAQLNRRGITKIIGMSQNAFWPEETNIQDPSAVPYRDLEEGSLYMRFLEQYEQSWYTLASAFPEIQYWEVGNETNSNSFLHPLDYSKNRKTFTMEEKALITADMTCIAARAVRRANPDATVIFPAIAPINGFQSMVDFLDLVYEVIEADRCVGGTDPDAYFDAVAWHCYYFKTSFTPENWLEGNNSVYQVMVNHGDGDKKVFLTEFGFSDGADAEKDALQASYFREIYRLAQEQMPYLDSLYPFRTIEDETAAEWGGTIEIYYGLFRVFDTEHFGAKEKAKAICAIYGGDLSKLDQYIGEYQVYPRS